MKNNHLNLIFLLITVIAFSSCNVEQDQYLYKVNFKNTSNTPFHLLVLGDTLNRSEPANDTLINVLLNKGEISPYFSYKSHFFEGFKYELTYVKVQFTNENKGYVCTKSTLSSDLCFMTKSSPIYSTGEVFIGNDKVYSYEITQEDYENAHVLP